MFAFAAYAQGTELGTFKCAALNVDGLPANISVMGVNISLNPDSKGGDGASAIGRKVVDKRWDFFAVSEDFNFNTELMAPLTAAGYSAGTYRGNISVTASALGNFLAQRPVTDTDGLNLIWNKKMTVGNEYFNKWNDHYGYTDNGADGLINKGYRFYTVEVAEGVVVDVYILHMDAEVTEGDIAARESQIRQLAGDILSLNNKHPKIVMGDTNCRYTRDRLEELFLNAINADERYTITDCWLKKCKGNRAPAYGTDALMVDRLGYVSGEIVDKMFFINHADGQYKLTLKNFKVDTDFNNVAGEPLADHYPVVGEFGYYLDESVEPEKSWDFEEMKNDASVSYYIYNVGAMKFLSDDNTLTDDGKVLWTVNGTDVQSANGKHISITSKRSGSSYNITATSSADASATSSIEVNADGKSYRLGNKVQVSYTSSQTRFLSYRGGALTYTSKNSDNTIEEAAQWVFVSEEQYKSKTQGPDNTVLGDADGDGEVTMSDANLVVNHYLGDGAANINEKNSDVDGDNTITMSDANAIVNIFLSK